MILRTPFNDGFISIKSQNILTPDRVFNNINICTY